MVQRAFAQTHPRPWLKFKEYMCNAYLLFTFLLNIYAYGKCQVSSPVNALCSSIFRAYWYKMMHTPSRFAFLRDRLDMLCERGFFFHQSPIANDWPYIKYQLRDNRNLLIWFAPPGHSVCVFHVRFTVHSVQLSLDLNTQCIPCGLVYVAYYNTLGQIDWKTIVYHQTTP